MFTIGLQTNTCDNVLQDFTSMQAFSISLL